MSDDLDFIVIDDIPEYVFCIPDDEELENVIPIKGEDGSFKYEKAAELPETGEDGVLYLVPKTYESSAVSGNPISFTISENAGAIDDFKIDGKSNQQTYSGKNLMNGVFGQGTYFSSTSQTRIMTTQSPQLVSGQAYTVSITGLPSGVRWAVNLMATPIYPGSRGTLAYDSSWKTGTSFTFTPAGNYYFAIVMGRSAETAISPSDISGMTFQLELGSSVSSYEPYVGGKTSPSPDYPQSVNNVTSTQTIDINGTSYPIDLGNIWLAKIGTYQDRIYKDEGKWYIEKNTFSKTFDGSESWSIQGTKLHTFYSSLPATSMSGVCDHFTNISSSDFDIKEGCYLASSNRFIVSFPSMNSADDLKTWLATNPTKIVCGVASASVLHTITEITDEALIAQLDAILAAQLAHGQNNIANTAVSPNLAGNMEITYHGYDPLRQHDEYIWTGNSFELIGEAHSEISVSEAVAVKSVNHRGYNTIAPENTLPAFKLSKQMGFKYVETDVSFTSDGVAVLLHDSTIDRTSNGTGNINSLTYEQVLQYDFGSWKSDAYAGTKIPTFEQFIKLCRNLGLHPYIELKSNGNYTEAQIQSIVDMVKANGMSGAVTYISFSATYLGYVKNYDSKARLGYLADVTSTTITTATGLKTSDNEVFMDVNYGNITTAKVQLCINANLPLEAWTVNTKSAITGLDYYVTGVTSDSMIASKVLYDANK